MTFDKAVITGFKKTFVLKGRSSLSEFWWFYLFCFLIGLPASLVEFREILTGSERLIYGYPDALIFRFIVLVLTIPIWALSVRRLHDIDRSGWFIFLNLILVIGSIILLIWHCKEGTQGTNRFGDDPLADSKEQLPTESHPPS